MKGLPQFDLRQYTPSLLARIYEQTVARDLREKVIAVRGIYRDRNKYSGTGKKNHGCYGGFYYDSLVDQMTGKKLTLKIPEKLKAELQKLKETPPVVTHETVRVNPGIPTEKIPPTDKSVSIPPPPVASQPVKSRDKRRSMYEPPPPPPHTREQGLMGGIAFVSNSEPQKEEENQGKKKEEQKVYLPPSFMEATLLSGLAAPTTSAGKSNPVPILMRIKDLAILPNKVKANLKGCFLIAEGVGNLADERVHARLLTLSCISRKRLDTVLNYLAVARD